MTVRTLLVAVAALVAGGFFVARALPTVGDSDPPPQRLGDVTLENVTLTELADHGLSLSPPPEDYTPIVSSTKAKFSAGEFYRVVPVKQVLLAHLVSPFMGGMDTEVWIVNFDTAGKPACPGSFNAFTVTLVDATSDQVLSGLTEETASSSPGCRHGIHYFATPGQYSTPAPAE